MRRLLAFVAAAAMIVAALVVRDRIDDDDNNGGGGGVARLTCVTELAETCETLERLHGGDLQVTVEPAGVTADRLSAPGNASMDAWLTLQPWPDIVAEAQTAAGLPSLLRPGNALARSPLVIAMWKDRAARLQPCGGTVEWKCLGEATRKGRWRDVGGEESWGLLKPTHPSPDESAGLLVLAQATAAFFGRTDLAASDLDDDAFRGWFTALEDDRPAVDIQAMLTQGPGAADAYGTTEAEAGPLIANSARRSQLALLYPSSVATADVVLATVAGGREHRVGDIVGSSETRKILSAAGWRVSGLAPVLGVGRQTLPPGNGLPPPGFLAALRKLWQEVAR
jgi:hypothetical protein